MSRRVRRPSNPAEKGRSLGPIVAQVCFALIVVVAPLLFGAVDRLPQIGLLTVFGIGLIAQPPAFVPLGRCGQRLAIAFVAVLVLKEFLPAGWFGGTLWRTSLSREFALEMPFTHHPEPSRAFDGLLAGVVGMLWFLWVRRLAADRHHRAILAWTLFGSAAIVALVSFATKHPGSDAIYGMRWTPGWSGFGPFPNRNHTADFLAMGAIVGCGCVTWVAARESWIRFCLGVAMLGLVLLALFATESRGGLIAFALGLCIYLVLCLCKVRSRRAIGAAVGSALIFGVLSLTFGSQVFNRFSSREAGSISNQTRLSIWHDALGMWRDAPLFGHGLGAFAEIFPFYQKIELENVMAIHPESSWLQWLTELGAMPVIIAVVALIVFLGRHLPPMFERRRGFFLHAGGLSAFMVLVLHAFFDVPAHRWGTAGFALAALAVACPVQTGSQRTTENRKVAGVPLAVAAFWSLALLWNIPAWSPLVLIRLITRDAAGRVEVPELERGLRYFPLNADLHQSLGLKELRLFGHENMAAWQRQFALAVRLQPNSWRLCVDQARACQRVAPAQALVYWQQAVDRGGIHRDEVLRVAVQETARFPAAQVAWGRYVEAHPELLLAYTQVVPEALAPYYFGRWWKARGEKVPDLTPSEVRDYYGLAARWGQREDFDVWTQRHADWEGRDFREWAALLHAWGDDDRAWQMLASRNAEPAFPSALPDTPRPHLETTWHTAPQNFVNAQQLALVCLHDGEQEASDEIVTAVAAGGHAPPWFLRKGAWILFRSGRTREAVALLLRAH